MGSETDLPAYVHCPLAIGRYVALNVFAKFNSCARNAVGSHIVYLLFIVLFTQNHSAQVQGFITKFPVSRFTTTPFISTVPHTPGCWGCEARGGSGTESAWYPVPDEREAAVDVRPGATRHTAFVHSVALGKVQCCRRSLIGVAAAEHAPRPRRCLWGQRRYDRAQWAKVVYFDV